MPRSLLGPKSFEAVTLKTGRGGVGGAGGLGQIGGTGGAVGLGGGVPVGATSLNAGCAGGAHVSGMRGVWKKKMYQLFSI